jgi:hypothetical protein
LSPQHHQPTSALLLAHSVFPSLPQVLPLHSKQPVLYRASTARDVSRAFYVVIGSRTSPAKAPPGFNIIFEPDCKTNVYSRSIPPSHLRASHNGTIRLRAEPAIWRRQPPKPPILLLLVLEPARVRTLDTISGRIWRASKPGISVTIRRGVRCTGGDRADGHGRVRAAHRMACSIWHRRVCGMGRLYGLY